MSSTLLKDGFGRTIDYLRLSVTQRCGFSCIYCSPDGRKCRAEELAGGDITRLARLMCECGISRIRLTGGEPLMREDISEIVHSLRSIEGLRSLTLTTNGAYLEKYAVSLAAAGLDGVNVSLDSLRGDVFRKITGCNMLEKVRQGIDAAGAAGLRVRINAVPLKGINEEDIIPLAELAKTGIDVRFIEYMPLGGAEGIPNDTVKAMLDERFGAGIDAETDGNGPAEYIRYNGFKGRIGFISAITHRFCDKCSRLRLTSQGHLRLCLCYEEGIDLGKMLDHDDEEIKAAVRAAVIKKPAGHDFIAHAPRGMWRFGG